MSSLTGDSNALDLIVHDVIILTCSSTMKPMPEAFLTECVGPGILLRLIQVRGGTLS